MKAVEKSAGRKQLRDHGEENYREIMGRKMIERSWRRKWWTDRS